MGKKLIAERKPDTTLKVSGAIIATLGIILCFKGTSDNFLMDLSNTIDYGSSYSFIAIGIIMVLIGIFLFLNNY